MLLGTGTGMIPQFILNHSGMPARDERQDRTEHSSFVLPMAVNTISFGG